MTTLHPEIVNDLAVRPAPLPREEWDSREYARCQEAKRLSALYMLFTRTEWELSRDRATPAERDWCEAMRAAYAHYQREVRGECWVREDVPGAWIEHRDWDAVLDLREKWMMRGEHYESLQRADANVQRWLDSIARRRAAEVEG